MARAQIERVDARPGRQPDVDLDLEPGWQSQAPLCDRAPIAGPDELRRRREVGDPLLALVMGARVVGEEEQLYVAMLFDGVPIRGAQSARSQRRD